MEFKVTEESPLEPVFSFGRARGEVAMLEELERKRNMARLYFIKSDAGDGN